MKRSEVIKILNDLEEKYPVDEWEIDNVCIWPIVKKDIFFTYFHLQNAEDESLTNKTKNKINNPLLELLRSLFKYFLFVIAPTRKKYKFIFASAHNYRSDIKGEFTNKFFQPLIDFLENEYNEKSLVVEYDLRRNKKIKYKNIKNIIFLKDYTYAFFFLMKIKSLFIVKKQNNLQNFDSFVFDVNNQLKFKITPLNYKNKIFKSIEFILGYSQLFNLIFKKYEPTYAMGLGYYSFPMYGMFHSIFKKKIIGIDMQHGGQGDLHIAYQGFNKHSEKGFSVLPQVFWCWDEQSAKVINKWAKNTNRHKVIVGGNPWISYCIENFPDYNFPAKNIILYTMQFNQIEDYIIDAIKETPDNYQWWIRVHPRKTDAKEHILTVLKQEGILQKVEIDKAIAYPLPNILVNTTIHISRFSGSIIEAAQLGVKNIILDSVGANIYSDYILSKNAIYFDSTNNEKLWSLISKIEIKKENLDNTLYGFQYGFKQFLKEYEKVN